jgi:NAD(P)-dependent dehydrogenase (short-subunit alcohol dehydrogenase family)
MQKTCVITGANAGIGKAAAIQIAQQGHRVFMGCRNLNRGQAALEEVRQRSQNQQVWLLELDMAEPASIQHFVAQLLAQSPQVDVLIHNAAAFDISQKSPLHNSQGIESIWATNHIGCVLLTDLLLPNLKQSPQGRVLTVASQGLMLHPNLEIDFQDPEFKHKKFSVPNAYYQSKLAQVMYTYWLAKKLKTTPVTVNCIRVTNVKIDLERYPNISSFARFLYGIKSKFSISPEQMAETYTYLALDEIVARVTGGYFDEKRHRVASSAYSQRQEEQEKLMQLTYTALKAAPHA